MRLYAKVNVNPKSYSRKKLLWPIAAIAIGALVSVNPFYEPHLSLEVGVAAWFADMALVLVLSVHSITARFGILLAGLFFAVPCFLWASPLSRGLLMCCMGFPFAISVLPLFAPPTADFRTRLAYFFTWMGTQKIKRRAGSFDIASLLRLITAVAVFAAALACVKMVSAAGFWLLARWLAGGIMVFAFAELITAGHDFLTTLVGISGPALMRSPFLSTSVGEFWTRRWNVAASALGFRPLFLRPSRGAGLSSHCLLHFSPARLLICLWLIWQWDNGRFPWHAALSSLFNPCSSLPSDE